MATRKVGEESAQHLIERYQRVRARTERILEPLQVEDTVVQPFPEVSPPKWHLGHTTWFFESMCLKPFATSYQEFDSELAVVFNSYYKTSGQHWLQSDRGSLSRPTLAAIREYRHVIDRQIIDQLASAPSIDFLFKVTAGIHHEEQHQELLWMDIKRILAHNPSRPIYLPLGNSQPPTEKVHPLQWLAIDPGIYEVGYDGKSFAFDNEKPRHRVFLQPVMIADRFVTNSEYLEFVKDGGYTKPQLWLSLGWDWLQRTKVRQPLYWYGFNTEELTEYTLHGEGKIAPEMPVTHVSYFEADAFARWRNCRLPTEFEYEYFLDQRDIAKEHSGLLHPREAQSHSYAAWAWTSSHYSPYPGFKSFAGTLGEYNGKFMCQQFVLKGGSAMTPNDHFRPSYRNFFFPEQRWQLSGIRLAKDDL